MSRTASYAPWLYFSSHRRRKWNLCIPRETTDIGQVRTWDYRHNGRHATYWPNEMGLDFREWLKMTNFELSDQLSRPHEARRLVHFSFLVLVQSSARACLICCRSVLARPACSRSGLAHTVSVLVLFSPICSVVTLSPHTFCHPSGTLTAISTSILRVRISIF